jgi:hypothetical protein
MRVLLIALICLSAAWAQKYDGPKPAKPDLPYLRHATQLIPLEVGEAKEEKRKEGTAYVSPGASSSVRTPMAEPIFVFESKSLPAEKLTLYKLEVKGNTREVFFFDNPKKRKDSARPLRLMVTRLAPGLSKLEANETLFPGEYALTPEGSNQVFLFQVY